MTIEDDADLVLDAIKAEPGNVLSVGQVAYRTNMTVHRVISAVQSLGDAIQMSDSGPPGTWMIRAMHISKYETPIKEVPDREEQ
jgi:hypothetical protein